jgi:hypothetical protein
VTRQLNARAMLTLEDSVEFFNMVLNMSLTTRSSSRKTPRSSCFDGLRMNRDDGRLGRLRRVFV